MFEHPWFRTLAVSLALLTLAGCGGNGGDENEYKPGSVGELYNEAMDLMNEGAYQQAAKTFTEVERQHPYSVWASKAQLMAAYAGYKDNSYQEAINALDRFIELHPGNRDIDYAHYLKGLSYYERIRDVRRDQGMTQKAKDAFQRVVKRFPDSQYARDAKFKLDLVENHLAGKDMAVGRFYQDKGHYLAAMNRFRAVVKKYQTTTHVKEALHRLVECYIALGLTEEAKMTASVLGHNFPASAWYADSYELLTGEDVAIERPDGDSWIGGVWRSVI